MIIYRYFIKEILFTLIAVTTVLFLIFLSNRFVRLLADAAAGTLPPEIIFVLVALKGVGALMVLVPLALFLAVLLAFGRFYKDNEMTALAASGIGPTVLLKSVLFLSLAATVVVAAISLYLAPWAFRESVKIEMRAQASADFTGIASGRFKEFAENGLIFYAENLSEDRRTMERVFVHWERNGLTNMITSNTAYQHLDEATGDRFLVLIDGERYEGVPGRADFKIIKFREHGIRIQKSGGKASNSSLPARPTYELIGAEDNDSIAELQWRIATPISTLLLALLAVPMSRTGPREGRYGKLLTAIFVYITYSNLMGVARAWLEQGVTPAVIGLWWVHGLLIIALLIMLSRQQGLTRSWFARNP